MGIDNLMAKKSALPVVLLFGAGAAVLGLAVGGLKKKKTYAQVSMPQMSSAPPPTYTYTPMGGQRVGMKTTQLSQAQANYAIYRAFMALERRAPTAAELKMLSAHSALETGNWKSMHNYNFGNFITKAHNPHFVQRVPEKISGEWVKVDQKFRSYPDATSGAESWLRVLKGNWPAAFSLLSSNDPAAYSKALKTQGKYGGYYTQDESKYTSALESRYA